MLNSQLGEGGRTPQNQYDDPPQDISMRQEDENRKKEYSLQVQDTENQEELTYRYENIEKNEGEQLAQEEFENSFDIENYEERQEFVSGEQNYLKEEQIKEVEIGNESERQLEGSSSVFHEFYDELENNEPQQEVYYENIYHNNESSVLEFNQLNTENTTEYHTLDTHAKPQNLFETTFEGNIQEEFIENEHKKEGSVELNKKEEIHSAFGEEQYLVRQEEKLHRMIEIPLKVEKQERNTNKIGEEVNENKKTNEEVIGNEEIKKTESLKREEIPEVVVINESLKEEEEKIKFVKKERKEKEANSGTKRKQNKKEKGTHENKKQNKSHKQNNHTETMPIIVPIKNQQVEEQEEEAEQNIHKPQVSTAIDIEPQSPKEGGNSSIPHTSDEGGLDADPTLSLIPVIIIKEAQKERISSILDQFEEFLERHRAYIVHQKRTITNVENEIEIRKQKKYVWYHYIREYFLQYLDLTTQFHDVSYKGSKQSIASNENELLNMNKYFGEGVHDLSFLKRETGNEYKNLGLLVSGELSLVLESVFNKFISEIKRIQSDMLKKKEEFTEKEDILRKRIEKNTKIYTRGRLGKKVAEDVFVETCMFIEAEKIFRKALINWGVGLKELRESFIALEQKLNNEIQMVVNNFKTASCSLYSFHPQSFERIISSKEEITKSTHFSDLCSLIDSDYIKYTYETATKTVIAEVSDNQFQKFMEMPHFEEIVGKPSDLLKGVINKSIHLKAEGEQLVNSISGNLVLFNSINSEYKDIFVVKNLSATIVGNGLIQFDEILPGFIFNDTRTIRLEFKDQDRAEELICLLNEIE